MLLYTKASYMFLQNVAHKNKYPSMIEIDDEHENWGSRKQGNIKSAFGVFISTLFQWAVQSLETASVIIQLALSVLLPA